MLPELAEDWLELWRDTGVAGRALLVICSPVYVLAWFLAEFFAPT